MVGPVLTAELVVDGPGCFGGLPDRRPQSLDVDRLLDLAGLARPEWQRRAACRGMGTEVFYPPRGSRSGEQAKAICASCPVADECRAFAVEHEPLFGVWGQTSPKERRRLRRDRRRELDELD